MKVNERCMYHFHPVGYFDDFWKVGNEFDVDEKFESQIKRLTYLNNSIIHVDKFNGTIAKILERHREKNYEYLSVGEAKFLFQKLESIVKNENIMVRELALEDFRQKNCPELPSRFHSIWVANKQSMKFWERIFQGDTHYTRELLELELTGNLFKTSDYLLPETEMDYEDALKRAHQYWNPDFTQIKKDRNEYLFQGNVKIMKKLEKITNSD